RAPRYSLGTALRHQDSVHRAPGIPKGMEVLTFAAYVAVREGLLAPDRSPAPGLPRLNAMLSRGNRAFKKAPAGPRPPYPRGAPPPFTGGRPRPGVCPNNSDFLIVPRGTPRPGWTRHRHPHRRRLSPHRRLTHQRLRSYMAGGQSVCARGAFGCRTLSTVPAAG